MRALLEVISVLERAGLAFIGIDAQIARRHSRTYELPFSPRGKSRPAETAQAGFGQDADHLFRRLRAGTKLPDGSIAFRLQIGLQALVLALSRPDLALPGELEQIRRRRVIDVVLAHRRSRRTVAAPHAGSRQDAHVFRRERLESFDQRSRPGQFAGKGIAHADGDLGRRRLVFLHYVEMMVEGRHLEDLGHGKLHLLRERREMDSGNAAESILDQVQIFDQVIAPERAPCQQPADLLQGHGLDLPALGVTARPAPAEVGSGSHRLGRTCLLLPRHIASRPILTNWLQFLTAWESTLHMVQTQRLAAGRMIGQIALSSFLDLVNGDDA